MAGDKLHRQEGSTGEGLLQWVSTNLWVESLEGISPQKTWEACESKAFTSVKLLKVFYLNGGRLAWE
jgi:hypothetical protein